MESTTQIEFSPPSGIFHGSPGGGGIDCELTMCKVIAQWGSTGRTYRAVVAGEDTWPRTISVEELTGQEDGSSRWGQTTDCASPFTALLVEMACGSIKLVRRAQ